MIFVATIVSALPWLPTPFWTLGLVLLAMMALFSGLWRLAIVALVVCIHDARVSAALDQLWPVTIPDVVCQGEGVVEAVSGWQPPNHIVVVQWSRLDCNTLLPGDRTSLRLPFETVHPGDRLIGQVRFRPIVGLANPGGSDARRDAIATGLRAQGHWIRGQIDPDSSRRSRWHAEIMEWPQPLAGFALALLFGERMRLTEDFRSTLSALGLAHLLAISGLHVGLLLGAVWWIFGRVLRGTHPRMRLSIQTLTVCALGCGIAAWTLWSPSVTRAVVMVVIATLCRLIGWRLGLAPLLAVTTLVLVTHNPILGLSVGFLMSVGAVALIAVLQTLRPLQGLSGMLRMQWGFSVTLNPLLSIVLGFPFPWLGLLFNLLVIPLLAPFLAVLAGLMLFGTPGWVTAVNGVFDQLVRGASEGLGQTLFAAPVSPAILASLLWCGLLSLLPPIFPRGLVGIAGVVLLLAWPRSSDPRLDVVDVGQGSAAVLSVGATRWLFDAGPGQPGTWDRLREIAPLLENADAVNVLLSHGDLDHIAALDRLKAARVPERVIGGGRISARGAPCLQGHRWQIETVQIEILWPDASTHTPENRASCVVLVTWGNRSVLLMGDADWFAEAQVIRALKARQLVGAIDVVVASHHGARDGSSPSFRALVGASTVLISAGARNRFGHPHREVIDEWLATGASVYRTDHDGALRYRFDDLIETARNRSPTRW